MKIASHQLDAFLETAKVRSFSKAADRLGVTQSALSQRIANLERELEVTLFIRATDGPRLTESGEALLRYGQMQVALEHETLSKLTKTGAELSGVARIAGFSSVLRSVIIPALAPFLRAHPGVQCEFRSYEMGDLWEVLRHGEADFAILDYHLNRTGVREVVLGREEYVVVESAKHDSPEIFLDHAPEDNATYSFFQAQGSVPKKLRRSFMGDVYGILDGVEQGLGRAVMSRHLVDGNSKFKVHSGYKRYFRDVTLHYFEQPYYSDLHKKLEKALVSGCKGLLD